MSDLADGVVLAGCSRDGKVSENSKADGIRRDSTLEGRSPRSRLLVDRCALLRPCTDRFVLVEGVVALFSCETPHAFIHDRGRIHDVNMRNERRYLRRSMSETMQSTT